MIDLDKTLSGLVDEYERSYGKRVTERAKQFTLYFLKHCYRMEAVGQNHAEEGREPLPASAFLTLFQEVLPGSDEKTTELQQLYADLAHGHYMDGFNSVGEGERN